jgi:twitching motility protein PilT
MPAIDSLFKKMLEGGGSDLHLEQGQPAKIRENGEMSTLDSQVLDGAEIQGLLKEICPERLWSNFEERGDIDFAYEMGVDARFRANYFRHFDGIGAIFRIIPTEILTLEKLGTPKVFESFGKLRAGLVLVTGPTGSGKSTTLAGIIDYINKNFEKKIVTIEEPVEFVHQSRKCTIKHREVGEDTKSFYSGLQGALKSDVDVILVGEMRDQETIELALTAVEMGILVFGTLHTNSAAKTIDRIIDVFPAKKKAQIRTVLANTLKGVVAQQLLRSKDGKRRYAAHEILLDTSGLAGIIRAGDTIKLPSLIQLNSKIGMQTMDDCLMKYVKEDKVSMEAAHLKALDKGRFEQN